MPDLRPDDDDIKLGLYRISNALKKISSRIKSKNHILYILIRGSNGAFTLMLAGHAKKDKF